MTAPESHPQRLRVAHLNPNSATPFVLRPDDTVRRAVAEELGISALPKLAFQGTVRASGGEAWMLQGQLDATVVQPCVVTLKPVRTPLQTQVARHYTPYLQTPEDEDVEMPDDTLEQLGQFIDLSAVMIEELALALPDYPRADGAEMNTPEEDGAGPGDTRRPFADLDKLLKGTDTPS